MSTKAAALEIEISPLDKIETLNRQADKIKESNRSRKLGISKHFESLYQILAESEAPVGVEELAAEVEQPV